MAKPNIWASATIQVDGPILVGNTFDVTLTPVEDPEVRLQEVLDHITIASEAVEITSREAVEETKVVLHCTAREPQEALTVEIQTQVGEETSTISVESPITIAPAQEKKKEEMEESPKKPHEILGEDWEITGLSGVLQMESKGVSKTFTGNMVIHRVPEAMDPEALQKAFSIEENMETVVCNLRDIQYVAESQKITATIEVMSEITTRLEDSFTIVAKGEDLVGSNKVPLIIDIPEENIEEEPREEEGEESGDPKEELPHEDPSVPVPDEEEPKEVPPKKHLREGEPKEWYVAVEPMVVRDIKNAELPNIRVFERNGEEEDDLLLEDFHIEVPTAIEYVEGMISRITKSGVYKIDAVYQGDDNYVLGPKSAELCVEDPLRKILARHAVNLDITKNPSMYIDLPGIPEGYEALQYELVNDVTSVATVKKSGNRLLIEAKEEGTMAFQVKLTGYMTIKSTEVGTVTVTVTDLEKEERWKEEQRRREEEERRRKEEEERRKKEEAAAKKEAERKAERKKRLEDQRRRQKIVKERVRRDRAHLPWIETEHEWIRLLVKGTGDPGPEQYKHYDLKKEYRDFLYGNGCDRAMRDWLEAEEERKRKEQANKMTTHRVPYTPRWDDCLIDMSCEVPANLPYITVQANIEGHMGKRIFKWWKDRKSPCYDVTLTSYEIRALVNKGYVVTWLYNTPGGHPFTIDKSSFDLFIAVINEMIKMQRIIPYKNR